MSRPLNLISLVLPAFNEEEVLPLLLPRVAELVSRLPAPAEVIFVNDGSRDGTARLLAEAAAHYPWLKVVEFARNFGHQLAITAGADLARGDVVVVMDADLQDPPEVVLELIERYRQGYDVVYARRAERQGESWFKRATAGGFYWLMRSFIHRELPENVGDFRLMSRPVVDAMGQLREQHRFVRGMVTWLGYRQTAVEFVRPARAAGQTKYPLRKMLAFAWRAISSFSGLPLRAALPVGGLLSVAGLAIGMGATVQATLLGGAWSPWWLIAALQLALTGLTLTAVGLLGDYLARVYDELKDRPLYVVRQLYNFRPEEIVRQPTRAALPLAELTSSSVVPMPKGLRHAVFSPPATNYADSSESWSR